ncbi:MAG: hypothetical protein HC888_13835 [Candidatus Competibacteraceae bacterium]|nr:hypothetical protein [Candidatus Competibacteraceae bacterium]
MRQFAGMRRFVIGGAALYVSLVLNLISLPVTAAPGSSPVIAPKVWHLQLESAAGGFYETWMSREAIRFKSHSFGYTLYAKSPDWQVIACRDDCKEKAGSSLREFWREREGVMGACSVLALQKPLKVTDRQFSFLCVPGIAPKGLKGKEYVFAGEQRANDLFVTAARPKETAAYVTLTADLGLPAEVYSLVSVSLNMPRLDGCLLETSEYFKDGERCWVIRRPGFDGGLGTT